MHFSGGLHTLFVCILQVDCIDFDNTGTLTIGKPIVVSTRLLENMVLREFYDYVAAAEVCFLTIYILADIFLDFGKIPC